MSANLVYLKEFDYNSKKTIQRMMDGLGKTGSATGNFESMMIESSSGSAEENVMHSLNDTVKLLECATSSLRVEVTKSKDASYATFSKLAINTVHCINDTLTLYQLSAHDASYWKYVQTQSCQTPTKWDKKSLWVEYSGMIANLMTSLDQAKRCQSELSMAAAGISDLNGKSVGEVLLPNGE